MERRREYIDDVIVTNNNDTEKILATVAKAIIDFTSKHTGAIIYVEGSSLSRTRRYQIGVTKYWHEIEPIFDLFGMIGDNEFQPFRKGKNYKAFLIRSKTIILLNNIVVCHLI